MNTATLLQLVRIAFMLGGSSITSKTGVDMAQAESVIGAVTAAVGAVWSLSAGIKARKAAQHNV